MSFTAVPAPALPFPGFRTAQPSVSGVSGGVVVILTWFYYLAQIVIAGAELLKTLEQRSQAATRKAPQAGNGSR